MKEQEWSDATTHEALADSEKLSVRRHVVT
jgi:hypothetical protein